VIARLTSLDRSGNGIQPLNDGFPANARLGGESPGGWRRLGLRAVWGFCASVVNLIGCDKHNLAFP
jgi:hypothetical protein